MPIPRPLIADISHGRCLPFVGAGFSKNALLAPGRSMPDWNELTAILALDAGTPPGTAPPAVAQRYQQKFGRVQLVEAVRNALLNNEPRPGSSHRAFARLPFDTVYTTNFDLLLEESYSQEQRPFRSLVGELQLPFHAGLLASSIVKMHGDLRHEEHIVLTESDYTEFMARYPVIATHLSAMLITRTPLFIGYSLSDPDFNQIRRVVRERLGAFERMAYVVQFDVSDDLVEQALTEKIHILSLRTKSRRGHDEVLAAFFEAIQTQIDAIAAQDLRASRPDVFEEIELNPISSAPASAAESPVFEATSKLCFVLMPFAKQFDEVYRRLVQPVAMELGLTVLRADEMAGPGFVLEQIRAAITQARIVIADVTDGNANVLYELGFAQALGKSLILVAKESSRLPFDVAHQRILTYGDDPQEARGRLAAAFLYALLDVQLAEAAKLLDLGSYTGAIATAAIVLEHRLREIVGGAVADEAPMLGLSRMLASVESSGILDSAMLKRLKKAVKIRNSVLHGTATATRADATFVLSVAQALIEHSPPSKRGRRPNSR